MLVKSVFIACRFRVPSEVRCWRTAALMASSSFCFCLQPEINRKAAAITAAKSLKFVRFMETLRGIVALLSHGGGFKADFSQHGLHFRVRHKEFPDESCPVILDHHRDGCLIQTH